MSNASKQPHPLSASPLGSAAVPVAPKAIQRMWGPGSSVILAGFTFAIGQLLGVLGVISYGLLHGQSGNAMLADLQDSTWLQFVYILVVEIATIGIIAGLLYLRRLRLSAIGVIRPVWFDLVRALLAVVVYFIAYLALVSIVQQLIPSLNVDQKQDIGFDNATGQDQLLLVFLSLVILPPLAEEILFRGFLFTGLRSKLPFVWTALITSLGFASLHLAGGVSGEGALWIAGIDTFVLSCVLCYLRERTGSVWPGILVHALKNGVAFTYLFIVVSH